MKVDKTIFRAYDIRGIVEEGLTVEVVRAIGLVLGTIAQEKGVNLFCVGRDGRLTGSLLSDALCQGLSLSGINVVDIGAVPTPVLYFATHHFKCGTGVAVTGSHNPPEYNGLKIMIDGVTLYSDDIQVICQRIEKEDWNIAEIPGNIVKEDVIPAYLEAALKDIKIPKKLKVIVDAGNGIAGPTMLRLLKAACIDVDPLFCEPDGHFPHHHPDPSKPENLKALITRISESKADLGLALDGDGDRLGVVTKKGEIIYPDRLVMLYAREILAKHPGAKIIYDVKCTRKLENYIRSYGGQPIMAATGHSLVKACLRETHALFAGEMSGHLFFNDDNWFGFDDALYAGIRLIDILSKDPDGVEVLNKLPNSFNTPELQISTLEGENKRFIEKFKKGSTFPDALRVITIDGVRVEWADGFALIRSSNTTPVLVVRFEGDNPDALLRISKSFISEIHRIDPQLKIPEDFFTF